MEISDAQGAETKDEKKMEITDAEGEPVVARFDFLFVSAGQGYNVCALDPVLTSSHFFYQA